MLPLRFAPFWWIASGVLITGVIVGSLGTGTHLPLPGRYDKLQHLGAYCFLAVWFSGLFTRAHYWTIGVGLAALGLAMEFLQAAMHAGRQGDPADVIANVTGIVIGLALAARATAGWAPKFEAWLARN